MIDLTPREKDVVRMLAGGLTVAGIAFALDMSIIVVDQVAAHVTAKLGTADIAEAVTKAIATGLISTEL